MGNRVKVEVLRICVEVRRRILVDLETDVEGILIVKCNFFWSDRRREKSRGSGERQKGGDTSVLGELPVGREGVARRRRTTAPLMFE